MADGLALRGLTRLSMWPERTDARVGVHRDGNQLPHSQWGPEVEQPKWCRPSGNGCGRLHYLTRSEKQRLGDGCDVVLAGDAGDACLRSKPGDNWGERFLPGPQYLEAVHREVKGGKPGQWPEQAGLVKLLTSATRAR
jgi:hypothetical protein